MNYITPQVHNYITNCPNYENIDTLRIYVKPKNEMFTRYVLATYCQEPGESLDQYLQVLKLLAKDCEFKALLAAEA